MFRRGALVAGGVLAALAITVPPAHASGGAYTTNHHGSVWFESYGEIFTVNDWNADGDGVRGQIEELRQGQGGQERYYPVATVYNGEGFHGPAVTKNLELPEGHHVRYKVCLMDSKNDTTPHHCSTWHYDKA